MLQRRLALALGIAALTLAGCATTSAPVSVADTIARDPQLSTLSDLVRRAGLADTLRGTGPFTVFAPTNDAFKAVPAKTLEDLGKNPEQLRAVLSYHVLPANLPAAGLPGNSNQKTVQGANVAVSRAGTFVTVEDAMVQSADITASNGVVHTIDRVLMPPRR